MRLLHALLLLFAMCLCCTEANKGLKAYNRGIRKLLRQQLKYATNYYTYLAPQAAYNGMQSMIPGYQQLRQPSLPHHRSSASPSYQLPHQQPIYNPLQARHFQPQIYSNSLHHSPYSYQPQPYSPPQYQYQPQVYTVPRDPYRHLPVYGRPSSSSVSVYQLLPSVARHYGYANQYRLPQPQHYSASASSHAQGYQTPAVYIGDNHSKGHPKGHKGVRIH